MNFKSRKFYVWLISLSAVVGIYLLCTRLNETPQIRIDTVKLPTVDANAGQFDSEIGMIGKVGVGTVRRARYIHLNKKKQVDREFGFEKLLHEQGNEWEIEKPYMNIFWSDFKCFITADKGRVEVETAAGRVSPADATLTGNVVIHILPKDSDESKEASHPAGAFIYLDDVVFISERSLFSTDGPVKFVSADSQMIGSGLELIYNNQLGRLEFLKIINLEWLRLKRRHAGLFASGQSSIVDTRKKFEIPARQGASSPLNYYKCIFSGNVVIDTPEQLIFTDQLSINNICWGDSGQRRGGSVNAERRKLFLEKEATKDEGRWIRDEELADIVVTCNRGVVLMPMDHEPRTMGDELREMRDDGRQIRDEMLVTNHQSLITNHQKARFVAERIDYDVSTGDTVARGVSELTFYIGDVMDAGDEKTGFPQGEVPTIPVKITAKNMAKFSPALNQVIFEGDTICTMIRADANSQQKYILSAPELTIDLIELTRHPYGGREASIEVKHITAGGGVVRLSTVKTSKGKLLGGIELKCSRFNYDAAKQLFTAWGPGLIKVNNSNISESKVKVGRFSLQRRCYAFLRDFDSLKYFSQSNRIVADAKGKSMLIDYFPIVEGKIIQQASATANHIEVTLYETDEGRVELSQVTFTDGITYEDEDNEFAGSKLFYDAISSVITIEGDQYQPCYFNGVLVDGIEYDLVTGKVEAEVTGPGALQLE